MSAKSVCACSHCCSAESLHHLTANNGSFPQQPTTNCFFQYIKFIRVYIQQFIFRNNVSNAPAKTPCSSLLIFLESRSIIEPPL